MADRELIEEAINQLRDVVGASDIEIHTPRRTPSNTSADATLTLVFEGERHRFEIETRRRITTNTVARLTVERQEARPTKEPILLVAQYIQPGAREILQNYGFNYLDAAGNCHIASLPLVIHVEGRRPVSHGPTAKIRAFGGEGLRVIFAFLLDPNLVSETYRDLATLCDVSHGVVQYTIDDLEQTGFLLRVNRTNRRLQALDDLLDRWVDGYVESLRPKLMLGRYRFRDQEAVRNWQAIELNSDTNRWGGEPAASMLTHYLRPGHLTLYSRAFRPELMKNLRLVPDDDGQLDVLRTFWTIQLEGKVPDEFSRPHVPAALAYADLTATDDPRNMEVASMLRKRLTRASM